MVRFSVSKTCMRRIWTVSSLSQGSVNFDVQSVNFSDSEYEPPETSEEDSDSAMDDSDDEMLQLTEEQALKIFDDNT